MKAYAWTPVRDPQREHVVLAVRRRDEVVKALAVDVHHTVVDVGARAIVGDRAAVQLHAHVAGPTSRRAQDE